MSSTAYFSLTLTNNTSGYITYNGFTNGIGSPPVSSGNPPLFAPQVAPGTSNMMLQASGGSYPDMETWIYPNTTGTVTFNLPDTSILTVNWDVPVDGDPTLSCAVSDQSGYEPVPTSNGGNYYITVQALV